MWPFSKTKSAKSQAEYDAISYYTQIQKEAIKSFSTQMAEREKQQRINHIISTHQEEILSILEERYPEQFL